MLDITRGDKKCNTWMRSMLGVVDVIARLKRLKWEGASHVAKIMDDGWTEGWIKIWRVQGRI